MTMMQINNKKLYISFDFEHLLLGEIIKGRIRGFDILHNSIFISLKEEQVMQVSHESSLFVGLIRDESVKIELAELFYSNKEKQALYLGVTERTAYRISASHS